MFDVCGAAVGDGEGVGDGATVLVVCGCVPAGEALASGVTVAVGAGTDCNGVTVAVGCGPAGAFAPENGVGVGSLSFCASANDEMAQTSSAGRMKRGTRSMVIIG